MDPLSHIALGRTLAALRALDDRRRGLTAAAMAGALAPDLDAVVMPFGWDRYLVVHEVGTHALAGSVLCALLVAVVIHRRARMTPLLSLWRFAWLGAVSHLALDLLSGARIRLAWPVFEAHVSLPVVAMADPILLGLLVTALLALWVGRRYRRRVAAIVLLAVAGFLAAEGLAGSVAVRAVSRAERGAGDRVLARVVEARWASLTAWQVFERTPDRLRVWLTDVRWPAPHPLFEWPVGTETPVVTASRRLSTVRNFLRVHDLGFSAVFPAERGGQTVLWSDLRFCWNPDEPGAPPSELMATGVSGQRLACGLWFGGEFDAAGAPVREIVRVGSWIQRRAPR